MSDGMNQKEQKNIHFINSLNSSVEGGMGRALLQEIVDQLQKLLTEDEPSHIDLRAISLSEADLKLLVEALGEGDVYAEYINYGTTRARQTGIPGVWWVVHLDEEEQIISEFIEINYCPEAMITPVEDIRDGREALQARLFEVDMARKHGKGD